MESVKTSWDDFSSAFGTSVNQFTRRHGFSQTNKVLGDPLDCKVCRTQARNTNIFPNLMNLGTIEVLSAFRKADLILAQRT